MMFSFIKQNGPKHEKRPPFETNVLQKDVLSVIFWHLNNKVHFCHDMMIYVQFASFLWPSLAIQNLSNSTMQITCAEVPKREVRKNKLRCFVEHIAWSGSLFLYSASLPDYEVKPDWWGVMFVHLGDTLDTNKTSFWFSFLRHFSHSWVIDDT